MGTRMARGVTLAATALLSLLLFAMPAGAGWEWCEGDPVVALNGTQLQIKAAIPVDYRAQVTGPVVVTVTTPRATTQRLVWTDAGFNGYGEAVTLVTGNGSAPGPGESFPVQVAVVVPLPAGVVSPLRVTVVPDNGAPVTVEGTAVGVALTTQVTGR
jgi:hypothetical protein